jgi:uncharacterized Zn-binding protein involved in type VI secretion
MGQPAARLTDIHVCPMVTGLVPHIGGPIVAPGKPTVLIGGLPAARVTDMVTCIGPPDVIVKGSASVLIGGLPAARLGDQTAHGGVIVLGFPTVLIGDASSGGGGAGGGSGGGGGGGGGGAGSGAAPSFTHLLSSGPALSAPVAQAHALVQAAKQGAPFCARCHGGK